LSIEIAIKITSNLVLEMTSLDPKTSKPSVRNVNLTSLIKLNRKRLKIMSRNPRK